MVMAQLPAEDCIRDIQDGRVYQNFIHHDPRARGRKVLSVVVSSDGEPLIKSKKFSIWPLICFLVELPPQERYKFENILLTGLWYGKSKPNVPLFLKNFTGELSNLANGSNFNNETGELVPSVCRIQSVVPDLPAKALLFNIKQYNVNLAAVYANLQGGMTGKHVQGCMNTGPLVLWLSEQHKKPGCLQELQRQEAPLYSA